ncbi:MAG: methyltransferase domain-containing protein, partial [Mariprofundaceae bacterium]|nr:methyltransferase domain-containing protein [Mariprofundaceae bacterium]
MTPTQRQQLIERHQHSFAQYGYAPDALFWRSRGMQKRRFQTLADIGIQSGDSVLDVGCGFGDLFSFLSGTARTVDYTGIDLSPDILQQAIAMHPDLALYQGDIFDRDWSAAPFDWVLLSGTLNWDLHDDGLYARHVITKMFELCRHGVALNMLDARHIDRKHLGDLRAYDPHDMLQFCQSLS